MCESTKLNKWELVWQDEFDGPIGQLPDTQKWKVDLGGHGWGNQEWQYYTNKVENVAIDGNSSLRITAIRIPNQELSNLSCWYGPCRYTSARLSTRTLFEFTYGRVEASIKIPTGQGIWSALWMLGADHMGNTWPHCGEIDIMENIGREVDTVYGTLHGPGYSHIQGIRQSYSLANDERFANDFHEFAIEWEPCEIRWYVDKRQFFHVISNELPPETEWVFDHPFFLVLNLAVGGTWPGYPSEYTVFPKSMLIDYVRVYQCASQSKTIGGKQKMDSHLREENIPLSYNHPEIRGKFYRRMVPQHGVCAEIGVHKGENIRTILDVTRPQKLHLIDPWYLFGKEWTWAKGNPSTMEALVSILRAYEKELVQKLLELHIGYDLDVLPTFPDQYFDWVYLDTSHQYEQTKKELEILKTKVKANGIITGNDWFPEPEHLHFGLVRAIREFLEVEPYELAYADTIDRQWAIKRTDRAKRFPDEVYSQVKPTPNHQMRGKILSQLVAQNAIGAEIGVYKGEFVRAILDLAKPKKLHLIDPWYRFGREWPWSPGDRSTVNALIGILKTFESELIEQLIVLNIGYDLDVLPTFPDEYFDWVYLDTSHRYEQTRKELCILKTKVKATGIIVGDDWYPDADEMHHGVYQAVNEFVESEPYEIIYADAKDKQWAIRRH